jgi:PAS domain S-box-containing protein
MSNSSGLFRFFNTSVLQIHTNPLSRNLIVRDIALACLVGFASYLTAVLGGALVLRPQMIWPLWPGCAFLVAILLLTPQRIWPTLLLSGLVGFAIYDLKAGLAFRSIALLIAADTIEILVAAFGVRYTLGHRPRLSSLASLAKYAFFAVILAPGISACVGAAAFRYNYILSWKLCFFTESLALLSLTPAILSWADTVRANKPVSYYVELGASVVALNVIGYITFISSSASNDLSVLYLPVPILLWSALRFGILGVSTSLNIVAFFSIWAAIYQRGPFAGGAPPFDDVRMMQLFFLTAASSFMVLGALMEEHRQSLQDSRESEQRFRLVANTAPVMIWMSGPEKLCNYFNQPWLNFTGRSLEAELGNGWSEGVYPEDLQDCLDTYTRSFDLRKSFEMQYRLRRSDGEYRWILDIGVPRMNSDGSFEGYIGSCLDVTDRKLAEEAIANVGSRLIAAHEEERTWFARELHDDINQRLALLTVQLGQWADVPPNSGLEVTDHIRQVCQSLSELGKDIQALSHRLHSSKLEYLGVVAAANSFCKELAEQQKVEIDFSHGGIPHGLHKEISLCLFRVLQESLQNAVKHSGARHFTVELFGTSEEIKLTVSDKGVGFDPQDAMNRLGIGLISMRERLHLVSGEISIESEPGCGTTILACVPLSSKLNVATAGDTRLILDDGKIVEGVEIEPRARGDSPRRAN